MRTTNTPHKGIDSSKHSDSRSGRRCRDSYSLHNTRRESFFFHSSREARGLDETSINAEEVTTVTHGIPSTFNLESRTRSKDSTESTFSVMYHGSTSHRLQSQAGRVNSHSSGGPMTACSTHFPSRFTRQYSCAMCTACAHLLLKIRTRVQGHPSRNQKISSWPSASRHASTRGHLQSLDMSNDHPNRLRAYAWGQ